MSADNHIDLVKWKLNCLTQVQGEEHIILSRQQKKTCTILRLSKEIT